MDDHPRQTLKEIIIRYGRVVTEKPDRLEGLLKDLAPSHPRENLALLLALKNRVVTELLKQTTSQTVPLAMQLGRLRQILLDQTPLSEDMAQWAVESWAVALGTIDESALQQIFQKQQADAAPKVKKATRSKKEPVAAPKVKKATRSKKEYPNSPHPAQKTRSHPGKLRWRYETGGWVTSSPAVSGGIVYVGSDDHHLYALDARSGGLRWRYETGSPVQSSPAVSGDIVYVGSRDHHLYALDAQSGRLRWRYGTGDWVNSSPTVSGGIVYVGSGDKHLYALSTG